jgi:putative transposase
MSRKGCSSDNAACEGFFGRIKNEMFYGRNWTGITLEKFICFLDRYIRWYNEKRIKLSLGAMGRDADLVVMVDCQIPSDDLIVHFF